MRSAMNPVMLTAFSIMEVLSYVFFKLVSIKFCGWSVK